PCRGMFCMAGRARQPGTSVYRCGCRSRDGGLAISEVATPSVVRSRHSHRAPRASRDDVCVTDDEWTESRVLASTAARHSGEVVAAPLLGAGDAAWTGGCWNGQETLER